MLVSATGHSSALSKQDLGVVDEATNSLFAKVLRTRNLVHYHQPQNLVWTGHEIHDHVVAGRLGMGVIGIERREPRHALRRANPQCHLGGWVERSEPPHPPSHSGPFRNAIILQNGGFTCHITTGGTLPLALQLLPSKLASGGSVPPKTCSFRCDP